MTNAYVLSGYLAAAAVLVLYCVHLRHRGRALARALGQPGAHPAPAPSTSSPVGPAGPGDLGGPAGPGAPAGPDDASRPASPFERSQ